jgi:hypothetical protein
MSETLGTDRPATSTQDIDRQIAELRREVVRKRQVQFVMPMLAGVLLAGLVYVLAAMGETAHHAGLLFGFWIPVAIVAGSAIIGLCLEVRAAASRNLLALQIKLLDAQMWS